ncbi:hypothetical protein [Sediminibacterium sp.]|uniref:hypothetical protein n=1 Tax=Sediminibacterium sp. TaxID=1917865 RepID=UPI002717F21E|nr:hypothetical protein [Sediminibacterium sp.]MDO8995431.1 hypothetical protein [Sediminibacterium sp.]MDO9156402.1 hypothetical protein [Sediminibacterium sp.]MDP2419702.1 hypothetical protein [Sediminibacterium sp.]
MAYKPYSNWKKWVVITSLLIAAYSANAEPSPNRVIILGTKHNGNKLVTVKSMLQIIERINPDIILLEFDSSVIKNCSINKVWGAKTAEFLGVWNNPIEYRAARKFKELKDSVCLAPFDIYIPNRKNYISYTQLMEKSHQETLLRVYNEGLLNASDANDYNSYTNINNAFLGLLDSSLVRMNNPNLTDTIQTIIYKEKHAIRRITMNYPALQPFSNWYNAQVDFWDERSEAINKKIWNELNANSNKTILIITGLLHKSDIENFLKRKELASLCTLISLKEALVNPPIADF